MLIGISKQRKWWVIFARLDFAVAEYNERINLLHSSAGRRTEQNVYSQCVEINWILLTLFIITSCAPLSGDKTKNNCSPARAQHERSHCLVPGSRSVVRELGRGGPWQPTNYLINCLSLFLASRAWAWAVAAVLHFASGWRLRLFSPTACCEQGAGPARCARRAGNRVCWVEKRPSHCACDRFFSFGRMRRRRRVDAGWAHHSHFQSCAPFLASCNQLFELRTKLICREDLNSKQHLRQIVSLFLSGLGFFVL